MREIKFRAKGLDTGKWRYGYYVNEKYDGRFKGMKMYDRHYLYSGGIFYNPIGDDKIIRCEVDPATVGQFTGMKDKSDREIYEGDIVEAWSQGVKAHGEVKQRIDGLWIIYPAWQNSSFWGLMPDELGRTTVEVIGNVFDEEDAR